MPLMSRRGINEDTVAKFEAAARSRFREAEVLYAAGERLGAVYLYGYSAENHVKAAYYRVLGRLPESPITIALRRSAEAEIRARQPKSQRVQSPGHDIVGWARLLEEERARQGKPAFDPSFSLAMHGHAQTISQSWAEFLRYRANKPYNAEADRIRRAANWFRRNAKRLGR